MAPGENGNLNAALEAVSKDLEHATEATAKEARSERISIYLFCSLDLVGSTALKTNEKFGTGRWIDVVRYFYTVCDKALSEAGVKHEIRKYIGDELVTWTEITAPDQIERIVRGVCRSVAATEASLTQQFGDAPLPKFVSVKGVAWLAPIRSYAVMSPTLAERHRQLIEQAKTTDTRLEQQPIDFIGPHIDAGFRLSKFARRQQLVVSPALAYYLYKSGHGTNNMKIVDVAELKGVAGNKLLPGVWYNESWSHLNFPYEDRFTDPLIRNVLLHDTEPVDALDEMKERIEGYGHFFDVKLINEIISAHDT